LTELIILCLWILYIDFCGSSQIVFAWTAC